MTKARTFVGPRKELMDLLRTLAYGHDLWAVFSDFVEMGAICFSNGMDLLQMETREARYMEIAKSYNKDDLTRFSHALGALTEALEIARFDDVLGSVFMELELGNKWKGQFFTPYHICYMMGKMTLSGLNPESEIKRKGFVTVNDPCSGGGAMLIGMAQAMQDAGINYQQHMYVYAQDLDIKAVHMAYIQLSLLHVPAVVIHGNTLLNEERSRWYTPAHFMGSWDIKLRHARKPDEYPASPAHEPEQEMHIHVQEMHKRPQPAHQIPLFVQETEEVLHG